MSTMRHILIIDDDQGLRELLAEQLGLTGEFSTTIAPTGAAGIEAARTVNPELILLDVGLPDLDGREVCRTLRKQEVKCPVIMLTASAGEADTIAGLEAGANDYVAKPFKLGVLLARIRAHLRQHEQSEDAVFAIGPYSFKPASKLLLDTERQNKRIKLTEKESAILKYLFRTGGKVVGRETLLAEVWGYNASVTTHTLETHIYRLRQKVERDPAEAKILLTEPGGYRLVP